MNMKKMLMFGLVLIAALSTMTALSATNDTTNSTTNNGTITIENLNFKLPAGYTEVEHDSDTSTATDSEDIDGTVVDKESSSEFRNDNGEIIKVKVGKRSSGKIDTLNFPGTQEKTINGKQGYFWTEMHNGKTEYKFEYLNDGKVIKIVTNSEDTLNQILS